MPRPGSSQVSSAAASDVEMEGGIEQRHTLGKARRKRPPEDHVDREWKGQKDSDSAGQYSCAIDEISRELNKILTTKEIEPEESAIAQLDNIRETISGHCKQNREAILY